MIVLKKYWKDILSLAVIALFSLVWFSGQVCDSDFWWQMKYGEYMLTHGTLIPDHTIYSWFPSDNATIYCAWIPQIAMYLVYKIGSLPAIYILRYAVFFLTLLPFYFYALGGRKTNRVAALAVIATLCWLLSPSIAVRPTMFSLPCFAAFIWIYFAVKRDNARWKLFYLLPLVMAIWVNSHGLFVFGGVFLVLAFAGELLNFRAAAVGAFDRKTLTHFFAASSLAALTLLVSPYGWKYPVNLVVQVFANDEYMKWTNANVAEFVSLWTANPVLFWVSLAVFAAAFVFIVRSWVSGNRDFAFMLLLVSTFGMALYYYRLNMLFGFVAAFVLIRHLSDLELKKSAGVFCAAYCAVLVLLCAPNMLYTPWIQGDLFSIDVRSQCAWEESAFVKRCGFKKVGNDHNIGSYMIWALGPGTKIMIDPRWFPYKDSLPAYTELLQNPEELVRYFYSQNCDAWVLSYPFGRSLSYLFYNLDDWKVGFYGQFGIVFVKKDFPAAPENERIGDFRNIHNIAAATNALMIACDFNDWTGAEQVLKSFDSNFSRKVFAGNILFAHMYYEGRRALFERKYEEAAAKLYSCGASIPQGLAPYAAQMLALELWEKGKDYDAYIWASKAYLSAPKDPINLYNTGVMGWWMMKQLLEGKLKDVKVDDNWRDNIDRFLIADGNNPSSANLRAVCARIIDGSMNEKPVMIFPPVPKSLSFTAAGQ